MQNVGDLNYIFGLFLFAIIMYCILFVFSASTFIRNSFSDGLMFSVMSFWNWFKVFLGNNDDTSSEY